MAFGKDYFNSCYQDYSRQNPLRKHLWYLSLLRKHGAAGVLLDIGCSYGLFAERGGRFLRCIGMDVSPEVVAEAASRVPYASFVAGKLPDVPFRGVDVVTALDVLEHVPDPERTLEALRGAVKPGGLVLVVMPVYDGPLGPVVACLDHDPTHIHKCSRTFWLDMLSRYFQVVEWWGVFRKLLAGKVYVHMPTMLFRGIAPAIAVVLRNGALPSTARTEEGGP